ncbi:winged helix-turn-helix transcriptional regulator [Paenibacillus sedimenti]|uniref:Helix-turn-helix transcriptional regulator n=1 Tax=Paenibacillus sedimenti TaxID=2770274 RepID=A0A926KKR3_9BACL|nr:helix-turn-helix domain-containing protein [Paenibacillus sedimenti]MBD0379455.1 helix-turn-helix transcriptional regulator [Paenibacillus sedimenti]
MKEELSGSNNYAETGKSNICEVLQILGAKWSFLVLEELLKGPQRFRQLQRNAAVIKTQSLTDTLRHLEHNGLVRREVFPTVPVTVEYSLTEKGSDFQAALKEMEKWVQKWGAQPQASVEATVSS